MLELTQRELLATLWPSCACACALSLSLPPSLILYSHTLPTIF